MNTKENLNKILAVIFTVAVTISLICSGIYIYNTKQKLPLERVLKISDTDVYIKTSYNDKYKVARLDVAIDEIVEDWQIKSLGNKTSIKLECETEDKTIKKEYEINNIALNKDEKIKGNLVFEDYSAKDYSMMKELLNGEIKLNCPEYITLDLKKREKLQQEFYKKQEKRKTTAVKKQPVQQSSNSFFNNLFNF